MGAALLAALCRIVIVLAICEWRVASLCQSFLSLWTIKGCWPCLELSGHREIVPEHTRWVGCEPMLSCLVVAE